MVSKPLTEVNRAGRSGLPQPLPAASIFLADLARGGRGDGAGQVVAAAGFYLAGVDRCGADGDGRSSNRQRVVRGFVDAGELDRIGRWGRIEPAWGGRGQGLAAAIAVAERQRPPRGPAPAIEPVRANRADMVEAVGPIGMDLNGVVMRRQPDRRI